MIGYIVLVFMAKLPNMISIRDELTKSQYAYFPGKPMLFCNTILFFYPNNDLHLICILNMHIYLAGGLVSFDNERSICDKTEYAIENNLNGFLIWELSGDMMTDLSTPLLNSVNAKLLDPNLDCETIASSGPQPTPSLPSSPPPGPSPTSGGGEQPVCKKHTITCSANNPCSDNRHCCSDWG